MVYTRNTLRGLLGICAVFCCFSTSVYADISVLQKLSFGEVVVIDNNGQYSITVNPDGSFNHAGAIIKISDPQHGIYQIDDLTPNSAINITATQTQPLSGGGNFFNLKDFQIINSSSNASGLADIILGATAQTSGNSLPYDSRTYNGTIQIQINY